MNGKIPQVNLWQYVASSYSFHLFYKLNNPKKMLQTIPSAELSSIF